MKPFQILGIILASLIILSFAIIVLFKEEVIIEERFLEPSAFLSIREVDVKPVEVTSSMIELNVTAYITNNGGKPKNASMFIRAINSNNRLLETQTSAPIPEIPQEKIDAVSGNLKVERNSGYELKILIFDNGSIQDSGSVNIRGLNTLTPMSKRSGIVMNNIDFTVSSAAGGKVVITSEVYLENTGTEPSENLKMIVKAREANSNLLADKKVSETGVIRSEATAINSLELEVPDEYNYMTVVELWRGDVLVNTWEKPVLLAPTKTVPNESVEKKVEIEVSDFARETAVRPPAAIERTDETPEEPGFGILAAITAFVVLIALRRRS